LQKKNLTDRKERKTGHEKKRPAAREVGARHENPDGLETGVRST